MSAGRETPDLPAPARRPRRGRRRSAPTIRSRWMWAVLALVAVALLGWLVVAALRQQGSAPPEPTATPSAPARQETLLIQVRNDAGLGADNLVAGVDGGLPPAQLLVPSRLVVDVPGAGQQTLARTARQLDRNASQSALSDLLALRIDGTLSLSRLALAGMVDYVGGVTVTLDAPITQVDPVTGVESVVAPAGTHTLDGTRAAAYALAWLPGESESDRLARYSTVITRTIAALPPDPVGVEQMLTSLGGSARTTTTTAAVAEFLLQMRAAIGQGDPLVGLLPTSGAQRGPAVVRVDLDAAQATLEELLPQAMLQGPEAAPRVLVRNGAGGPALSAAARDRLVAAGMVFVNGGNAERGVQRATTVVVPDQTAASLQFGAEVASALGVPASAVAPAATDTMVADAEVVLGQDFEP